MKGLIGLNPSFPLEISIKVHTLYITDPAPTKKTLGIYSGSLWV